MLSTLPVRLEAKRGTFSDERSVPHEAVVSGWPEQGSARSEKVQMRNERGLGAMTGEGMVSGGEWVSEMFRKQGKNKKTQGVFLRNTNGANIIYPIRVTCRSYNIH